MNISEVDFSKFKAAMFDYDGTLTQRSEFAPPDELVELMIKLTSDGFPIAICTGRQLESFERRFGVYFEKFSQEALKNFYLFGENGAIGYKYDSGHGEEGGFVEIHRGQWPDEIPKDEFKRDLLEATSDIAEYVDGHEIPFVLRPINALNIPIDDVHVGSDLIFDALDKFIPQYKYVDPDSGESYKASDYLHYGNSGLGCIVVPASSDKDSAIKAFHSYLFGGGSDGDEGEGDCREIMVVGDNPNLGGNDHYFLKGTFGTSFTVGRESEDLVCGGDGDCGLCYENFRDFPVKVYRGEERLFHSDGTVYLLRKVLDAR